jgi:hypothetical protein
MRKDTTFPSKLKASTVVLGRVRTIRGTTRDSLGAQFPFCTVHLLRTSDDVEMATTLSDANGTYSFPVYDLVAYYVVATRFAEFRWDSNTILFDSDIIDYDEMQVDGASQNTLVGT